MDCSPPGSSVLGILQARILEWVDVPVSKHADKPPPESTIREKKYFMKEVVTWKSSRFGRAMMEVTMTQHPSFHG